MPPKTKTDKNRREPPGKISRELWVLSGNECALTGCGNRLVGEDGSFIGEVAHIRGAEDGSARHTAALSRDALRAAENLMLLCANCHTKIDHVNSRAKYTVPTLQRMKKAHEDRFKRAAEAIEAEFRDYTKNAAVRYCSTLNRLSAAIGSPGAPSWTAEERAAEVCLVNGIADRLSRLTDAARNLLAFLVEEQHLLGLAEVSRRTKTGQYTVRRTLKELDRHGYAYIDPEPGEGEPLNPVRLMPKHSNGWPFFDDLQTCFSDDDAGVIRRIIVDLDFSVLD